MWVRRDYFLPYFLSLLFYLLNQTAKNTIFHPIFLSLFSIILVFTSTKHTLSVYWSLALSTFPSNSLAWMAQIVIVYQF